MASDDELTEFQLLSLKVSERTASEAERQRWRELREVLRTPTPPPPPVVQPAAPPASSPAVGEERRRHARAGRKLRIGFAVVEELHATFTEELSAGGMTLRLQAHVKPETPMVVRLELAAGEPLLLSARVVWCRREGGHFMAGVEWMGLRDDQRAKIEAWLSSGERGPGS